MSAPGLPPAAGVQLRAEVVEALGFHLDKREHALRRVAQITATALKVSQAALIVFPGADPLVVASFGRDIGAMRALGALCARALESQTPQFIEDVRACAFASALPRDDAPLPGLFAAIPIRSPVQRIVIGALCVYQAEPGRLSLVEQRLLGECAGLIEDELQLRLLSVRDELTGLLNRREFDLHFKAEWRRACHGDGRLATAILDIDLFKQVNDSFGHARGDAVLREVADLTAAAVRQTIDSVGRYGGEEFALCLPGMSLAMAKERMTSLGARVREAQIANPGSPTGYLSVSIGIAALEGTQDCEAIAPERMLLFADDALYEAKNSGRDRVCVHPLRPAEA